MIQRYLYTALSQGLDAFLEDPSLFDQLFTGTYGLDPSEVAEIKTYFARTPINLYQGYPPVRAKFPLVTILLAGEEQTDLILSRSAGTINDPTDPNYRASQHSAIWHHTYQVLVYAENIDVCSYLYELAKAAIVASYDFLRQSDVDDVTMSGMDLSPDIARLPEHLYARVLQLRCRHELLQADVGLGGKAYKVDNIFLPSASNLNSGGVIPGVSVLGQGDEGE